MCFIFPNKRAPETITINDFFSRLSEMRTADRLTSLLTLYDCYKELNPAAEPLDEFMFWGGIILNDFAEVDKYRVAPGQLFQNIADYRHLQGDFDFLEPAQREAMEHFLGQFENTRNVSAVSGTSFFLFMIPSGRRWPPPAWLLKGASTAR